jgi:hypothetical protein
MKSDDKKYTTPEQLAYATVLDWGMKIGFVGLVITFLLYVFGIITPHVPLEQLPYYWSMSANEYLKAANVGTGWSWLYLSDKGDFINFFGIAFLSLVTIVCYMRILPIFLKNKDNVYATIAGIEILVLVLAASGILVIGH